MVCGWLVAAGNCMETLKGGAALLGNCNCWLILANDCDAPLGHSGSQWSHDATNAGLAWASVLGAMRLYDVSTACSRTECASIFFSLFLPPGGAVLCSSYL